jgi:VIT1/CCC1 family predicted Fe2+/Mn2+ transporter
MAAGEFVSVSSTRDAEDADIAVERAELAAAPEAELDELASIYRARGLDADLARRVAEQLTARDVLNAHLRDELSLDPAARARPLLAALVSALSFASCALVPVAALWLSPAAWRIPAMATSSLLALAILGGAGGALGGASVVKAGARVVVGGGFAMAVTALIGRLFDVSVG